MFTFNDRQPNLCSKTRFEEHMKTTGFGITEVGMHLSSSFACNISFDDCKVLTFERNQCRKQLTESLYIQQYDDG